MHKGVGDMEVAFALSDMTGDPENAAMGIALSILFGQHEGGEFDWDLMRWVDRRG